MASQTGSGSPSGISGMNVGDLFGAMQGGSSDAAPGNNGDPTGNRAAAPTSQTAPAFKPPDSAAQSPGDIFGDRPPVEAAKRDNTQDTTQDETSTGVTPDRMPMTGREGPNPPRSILPMRGPAMGGDRLDPSYRGFLDGPTWRWPRQGSDDRAYYGGGYQGPAAGYYGGGPIPGWYWGRSVGTPQADPRNKPVTPRVSGPPQGYSDALGGTDAISMPPSSQPTTSSQPTLTTPTGPTETKTPSGESEPEWMKSPFWKARTAAQQQ